MMRSVPIHPMSRTAGSAFGLTARAGVIAALPAVGYLERWAEQRSNLLLS
jgi:hypothetical protein